MGKKPHQFRTKNYQVASRLRTVLGRFKALFEFL